jgi:hypothetical protein
MPRSGMTLLLIVLPLTCFARSAMTFLISLGLMLLSCRSPKACQPARKTDPLSAPNIDPTFR